MNRFFVNRKRICGRTAVLEGEDVTHIRKVLRLRVGECIELCDGEGTDYMAEIRELDTGEVKLFIKETYPSLGEPQVKVTLCQGIPKGSKMDTIIQKCVELGVHEIIPVFTDRTVVKLETRRDEEKKTVRWRKIAEEAAKQSRRGYVPDIKMPIPLKEALSGVKCDLKLIPWEGEREQNLKPLLKSANISRLDSIAFMVGPEGGFEDSEVQAARDQGWLPVTLGPRILRTETVGMAMISIIMFCMEEMEWKRPPGNE